MTTREPAPAVDPQLAAPRQLALTLALLLLLAAGWLASWALWDRQRTLESTPLAAPAGGRSSPALLVLAAGLAMTSGVAFLLARLLRGHEVLRRGSARALVSERRCQQLFDESSDVILHFDAQGQLLEANRQAALLLGREPPELFGATLADLLGPDNDSLISALTRLPPEAAATGEWRLRGPGGELHSLHLSSRRFSDGTLQAVGRETHTRHLDHQGRRQAQKMEALGRLASGVAHDFNNLLTAILGFADIARSRLDAGSPSTAAVDEIVKAGQRGAALTNQLLAFGRRQHLRIEELDLNSVIRQMSDLLHRLLGERVSLSLELDPRLGWVRGDRGQLEQVVLNLALNARDAMPTGGTLLLRTQNHDVEAALDLRHDQVEPGQYVMLTVRDTGTGIPEQAMGHIFEPFFTTKEASMGTGLGLATVYGIVKQSGGAISVYNEPEGGATFKVTLPRVAAALHTGAGSEQENRADFRGSGTLLLVEDDAMVRQLIRQTLEDAGYRVHVADDGEQALAEYADRLDELDLVVSDVVMPRVDGPELVRRLRQLRPELKAILMSGYANNLDLGALEETAFLRKPFSPEELALLVRTLLSTGPDHRDEPTH